MDLISSRWIDSYPNITSILEPLPDVTINAAPDSGSGSTGHLTISDIPDLSSVYQITSSILSSLSSVSSSSTGLLKITNGVVSIDTVSNFLTGTTPTITSGTGIKITYDNHGLVTGSSSLLASDIPDLSSVYQTNNQTLTSLISVSNSSTGLLKITNGSVSIDTTHYLTGNSITGGTGIKITYDSNGLITSSTSLVAADIPDLSSVYQPKNTTITSLSSISNSSTGLLKIVNGAISVDNTNYLTGSSITGGTGTKITYDNHGLITGSASLMASDLPDLSTVYQIKNTILTSLSSLTTGTGILKISNGSVSIDTGSSYLSGTVSVANGGTNATSFTIPANNISPILFFDGTKVTNSSSLTSLGYNTVTDTLVTNNFLSKGVSVFTGVNDTQVDLTNSSTINLAVGTLFIKTITTTTTFSVTNVPTTGLVGSFILELTNAGSSVVNWFSGIKWDNGIIPTLTVSGTDVLGFYTYNGGLTWRGMVLSKDSR